MLRRLDSFRSFAPPRVAPTKLRVSGSRSDKRRSQNAGYLIVPRFLERLLRLRRPDTLSRPPGARLCLGVWVREFLKSQRDSISVPQRGNLCQPRASAAPPWAVDVMEMPKPQRREIAACPLQTPGIYRFKDILVDTHSRVKSLLGQLENYFREHRRAGGPPGNSPVREGQAANREKTSAGP